MKPSIKTRAFKRLLGLAGRFPSLAAVIYRGFRFLAVRAPFLNTRQKWRAIRLRTFEFEVASALERKGLAKGITQASIIQEPEMYPSDFNARPSVRVAFSSAGLSIKGTLPERAGSSLTLSLDGFAIKSITVSKTGTVSGKISLAALRKFPEVSRLTLEAADGPIPCNGRASILLKVPSGSGTIIEAAREGLSLNKRGLIASSKENMFIRQNAMLDLYLELEEVLFRETGIRLFLMYGTLLGTVRDNDLIPNDDDFDAGYISVMKTPRQVKLEAFSVIESLVSAGYNVSVNPIGRMFKVKKAGVRVDIMPVWFNGSWSVAYKGIAVRSGPQDYAPAKERLLRGKRVLVPAKPEVFLEGYYGPGWKTPDPGYLADLDQTGKSFPGLYDRFLMTPLEFFRLARKLDRKRANGTDIGKLTASALKGAM